MGLRWVFVRKVRGFLKNPRNYPKWVWVFMLGSLIILFSITGGKNDALYMVIWRIGNDAGPLSQRSRVRYPLKSL